ncbi:hypothetical protein M422DRAFT_264580 [Sphaerobolus stellatus SS14]|uniref:Uncharacterized protein n=1 Tax=Sphaerobolus stellatus (strain SS14) TaxID=990650 RepID=A0A0C9V7T9_SPHS4|nr:hypothetical protein M422DRAFT_264580 [Sphaerobolus stellatus SS14]
MHLTFNYRHPNVPQLFAVCPSMTLPALILNQVLVPSGEMGVYDPYLAQYPRQELVDWYHKSCRAGIEQQHSHISEKQYPTFSRSMKSFHLTVRKLGAMSFTGT